MLRKRVLIIYYSFTQQTRLLLKNFGAGLEQEGFEVVFERLEPQNPYEFPFRTDIGLARAMVETFFRKRSPLYELNEKCYQAWDHVVVGGPTWSYYPSGPVLSFLDRYGNKVCGGGGVTVFISCRSYWRLHYWSVRRALIKSGARVTNRVVYEHPIKEPFRFIGLVLQLRGKMIRKEKSWFRKHYPGYGHSKEQLQDALKRGRELGRTLRGEHDTAIP